MSLTPKTENTNKVRKEGETTRLKRSLKVRHMGMIAIGGAIGTGLFLATGASISTAGPGGALVAYMIVGIILFFIMNCLGEMASLLPVPGSFQTFASRYVDPALGFALGWNYVLGWAITIAGELVASAMVMKFWFPDVPSIVWNAVFLVVLFVLNMLSTKSFGESEFWFASIKVVAICLFLIIGSALIFGFGGKAPGFSNWVVGDAPFVGGFLSIFSILFIAAYAYGGSEVVAIAAGESEDPEKNVPKAIKSVFWRMLIFFIGSLVVIGFIIPYTDPQLLKTEVTDVSVSPFTLVFQRAGFASAASIMNFVILTSILSAGNSSIYVASRMLYAMATEGRAPKVFAKLNRRGVPHNAIYAATAIGLCCFITSAIGEGKAYIWLLNCSALTGFVLWVGVSICHLRFRKGFLAQGHKLDELKFTTKFFPYSTILALIGSLALIASVSIGPIMSGTATLKNLFASYISLFVFLGFYFIYKYVKKTKIVSIKDMDFTREE